MKFSIKKLTVLLSAMTLIGCGENQESYSSSSSFGDFGYYGLFLREYATKQIGVEEAKELVDIAPKKTSRATSNSDVDHDIEVVLTKYASLVSTVKYYISDREEQQVREDIYQGTDFKYLLDSNHYEPFGQMSVKYLFVNDELLDQMEVMNEEFKESKEHLTSPFNEPYTYHTNEDKTLILQTHSFAELPASTCGGIGSTFRQDCELLFDEEGKITYWQSSLGLYTSTPTGTVKEGYIFEVSFNWIAK